MYMSRGTNILGAWSLVVADAVRSGAEAAVGAGGETPGALVTISAFPGQTLDDLRRTLELSQPGTLRLVDRLVEEGWVERRQRPGQRARGLQLTAGGNQVVRLLLKERNRVLETLLEPLNPSERRQLEGLLEKALFARAAHGRDPRHVCRICDRRVCDRCPVDLGGCCHSEREEN